MTKLVTVGIPVYKRLTYLPQALQSVLLQDYSNVELIVSDNGNNGSRLVEIVNNNYSKPYKIRQNSTSVPVIKHFNQIIDEASGEYFVLLPDDDTISPNYISELVNILEGNPQVAVAFSKTEAINEDGHIFKSTKENVPPLLSIEDFIKAWCLGTYKFTDFSTNMARTSDIRLCGGLPDFSQGNHSENALVVKLCLNRLVAFNLSCVCQYRVYESSLGLSVSCKEFAEASTQFLSFLDSDPKILEFSRSLSNQWNQSKAYLVKMIWKSYFNRWSRMYRERVTTAKWVKSAFLLPFIPAYYAAVLSYLARCFLSYVKNRLKPI